MIQYKDVLFSRLGGILNLDIVGFHKLLCGIREGMNALRMRDKQLGYIIGILYDGE